MSKQGYELMGQNVNGYTIIKPIGQGKFSIVYRAQKDGQPYAVKKIKVHNSLNLPDFRYGRSKATLKMPKVGRANEAT